MLKRLLFITGLLLLLLEAAGAVVVAREGLRLERVARSTPASARDALHVLTGLSLSQPDAAALQQAQTDLTAAGSGAQVLLAAVEQYRPLLAPALQQRTPALELQQTLAVLTAVEDGDALASTLLHTLTPLLAQEAAAGDHREQVLQQLQQDQPALAAALLASANLDRELHLVRGGRLARSLQSSLTQEQRYLPLAQDGLRLAIIAPALLGADGQQSYLVVAQDPADLRPTGGFLGSWGILSVDRGQITSLKYQAYTAWENVRDPQRDWPLQTPPVQRYFGYCCMDMQDANWYPDFPTTARVLERFSQADQPAPLSGVIAFDPALVQTLLRVTGPVDLPAQHVTVTADNVVDLANYYEGRGAGQPPADQAIGKQFLVLVAQALATRLTQNPHLSPTTLGAALLPLLNDKHVLLAFNSPDAAAVVAELGWDGAIATPPGDYLLLDEISMSDNKIDESIARSMNDTVKPAADGSADVTSVISISNRFPLPIDPGAKTTDFRDFLRLYLPAGASAVHLAGVAEVWPISTESGHVVASGYAVIPRGATRVVTVTYHVPAAVVAGPQGNGYALHVQVQPGIQPIQFQLHVLAPNGSQLTNTSASLIHDQRWFFPVAAAAGRPASVPTWDRACIADELVAGLKGPFSTHQFAVPAECTVGAKPS
jgi:hypothetical protein